MTCPLALHDGAYLLGALSPEDRRAYEEHLAGCAACSAALAEMAGLPGLLGRLPADVIEIEDASPPDVLPALLAAVQLERHRARRRFRIAVAAVATAAAVVGAALLVPAVVTPPPKRPAAVAFAPLADVPVTAAAALITKSWGTEVDLRCTYTGAQTWGGAAYTLVAIDRSGHEEQIATWRVVSNKPVVLVASTSLQRADLAMLEVRLPTGRPVLRLRT
ncbi:MAG: zf-HC2 domain-containing protein [Actinomycetota bacterium]|nr:zf-HC2 domain-containing protein [Actinomycetota bacterium]